MAGALPTGNRMGRGNNRKVCLEMHRANPGDYSFNPQTCMCAKFFELFEKQRITWILDRDVDTGAYRRVCVVISPQPSLTPSAFATPTLRNGKHAAEPSSPVPEDDPAAKCDSGNLLEVGRREFQCEVVVWFSKRCHITWGIGFGTKSVIDQAVQRCLLAGFAFHKLSKNQAAVFSDLNLGSKQLARCNGQ